MAAITHVSTIGHVAEILGEDLDLLEAIVENDDNLTYGSIVSIYTGQDACITALTDNGIEELKDMLTWARASETEWRNFLQDFVGDPEIIERVKSRPPR